jgi:uncharacterized protein (UPF0335 family)
MGFEKSFIEKLDNFTTALEEVVDILKEQSKGNPTESINKMLNKIDNEKLSLIVDGLKEVRNDTKSIKSDVKTIVKEMKASRQAKETGMFGVIEDNKNKSTILKGVQTILLIAGGVLAIGMAFKIIGKVDFLSVMSLSMSIVAISYAFEKLSKMKDLRYLDVLRVSFILPIMAAAITASAFLLKNTPQIGFGQFITIAGVGLTLGIAGIGIGKLVEHIKLKDIPKYLLLPILIPIMATGIVTASIILNAIQPIGFDKVLSSILVGVALIPTAMAFYFIVKGLKNTSSEDILFATLAIPLMAGGIVTASYILQGVQPITFKTMLDTMMVGLAIGVAALVLLPAIFIIKKTNINIDDLAMGAIGIIIVAGAIAVSSYLLSSGDYSSYPSWQWALFSGLSIILFTPAVLLTGLFITTLGVGIGLLAVTMGAIGVLIIAGTIMATSYILGEGSYTNFPTLNWALGTGLSIIAFGMPMMLFGSFIAITLGLGLGILALGGLAMLTVAGTIVEASKILSKGVYDKFPTMEWSSGVAIAIGSFVHALQSITSLGGFLGFFGGIDMDEFTYFIKNVSLALVESANTFNKAAKANVFDINKVPSKDWAEGVGIALTTFTDTLTKLDELGGWFGTVNVVQFKSMLVGLVAALVAAADEFNKYEGKKFDVNKVPSKDWAEGVGTALVAFTTAIKNLDESGIDLTNPLDFLMFIPVMQNLAMGIIKVGETFSQYSTPDLFKMDKVPSKDWAEGVGGSIKAFAEAIKALDDADVDIDADDLYDNDGAVAIMIGLSMGLISVASIFNKYGDVFKTTNFPSSDFGENISSSLTSYVDVLKKVEESDINVTKSSLKLISLMSSFLMTSAIYGKMSKYEMPSNQWVTSFLLLTSTSLNGFIIATTLIDNVKNLNENLLGIISIAGTMYNFAKIMSDINNNFGGNLNKGEDKLVNLLSKIINVLPNRDKIEPLKDLVKVLNELANIPWYQLNDIGNIGNLIDNLSTSLDNINVNKVSSLLNLGLGLQLMALIDEDRLEKVLNKIDDKKEQLKVITDENGTMSQVLKEKMSMGYNAKGSESNIINKSLTEVNKGTDFQDLLLGYVKNIDSNINKMVQGKEEEEQLQSSDVED